ncbi:MAG: hypothetical protein JWQ09_614 [Segetibacter sp.]|nr:hypothetical protein [Segetibacter sp.]
MAYLVDSNVIINYVAENFDPTVLSKFDRIFDLAFNHSVIAIMEVMGFNGDPEDMEKFEKLFISGQRFVINDPVIRKRSISERLLK